MFETKVIYAQVSLIFFFCSELLISDSEHQFYMLYFEHFMPFITCMHCQCFYFLSFFLGFHHFVDCALALKKKKNFYETPCHGSSLCFFELIFVQPEVTRSWWISAWRSHLRTLLWRPDVQALVFHQNANDITCNIQCNIIVVLIDGGKIVDGYTCPLHYSIIFNYNGCNKREQIV